MMSWLPDPDAVVTIALVGLGIEGTVLYVLHRRWGIGPAPSLVLPFLVAGACLLFALKLVLDGRSPALIVLALVGALVAHGVDLRQRWRR
jgi:hypothetical protein